MVITSPACSTPRGGSCRPVRGGTLKPRAPCKHVCRSCTHAPRPDEYMWVQAGLGLLHMVVSHIELVWMPAAKAEGSTPPQRTLSEGAALSLS